MDLWKVENRRGLFLWLGMVLVVAILVRAGLWMAYPLAESNDTPTYRHLSSSLGNHGFDNYNGTRTPGYPLFLLITGSDAALYVVQLVFGVLTTLLVFYIAWKLTFRAWFAGALALAHTLNLGQLFFEASVLSESLATFLLFCVLAGLVGFWGQTYPVVKNEKSGDFIIQMGIALLIGLVAAALAMTRPLFAPVAFWGALFLAFFSCARQGRRAGAWKIHWGAAMLVTLPAVIFLALWVNFIHTRFKIWGLDSMGGYHLVNHTSSFFELAPDEYASVRDTFLQFRAIRMAETGSPVNTIWDAIPTLMEQEKLNYYALGRLMGKISQRLIAEHPSLYAQNLLRGWWWFWRVGVFWLPGAVANPVLRSALSGLMLAERLVLFGVNMPFLGGSVSLLWSKARARLQPPPFIWFAASAVWITSVLQTLAEHGDNPRFLAPMQTLVVLVVAWALFRLFDASKSKI
jgi:hypothetical protein